jgi:type VI secretion system secreted protein Hcp
MNQMNFLKIDDIQGESKFQGHTQEIDVVSWNWGFETASSTPADSGSASRITVSAFTFSHYVDLATPVLMKTCLSGTRKRQARLSVRSDPNARFDHFVLTFDDVMLTASSLNAADNASRTLETVTFTFKKVTEDYTQTKADGSAGPRTSASYDIAHNH